MKVVKLVHNPASGDEVFSKDELMALIEAQGFQCRYSSTKEEDWKELTDDIDLMVVAGGDGTVRKVVKLLLQQQSALPLCVLPLGTANNIAKTLGLDYDPAAIISGIKKGSIKAVDVGLIDYGKESSFFIEGFGYGIFPLLMQLMKNKEDEFESAGEEIQAALRYLHEAIENYQPRHCRLELDGTDHSGKFLLAEIMNMKSIGPNLTLAPLSDPGDGELDVVLVPENQKEKFSQYILHLMEGGEDHFQFYTLRAKQVNISWQGSHAHIDDKVVKLQEGIEVKVNLLPGRLQLLLPDFD